MSWPLITIVLLGVAFAVAMEVAERTRVRKFLDRPCVGLRWHRQFPLVPHAEIREFLVLFTKAFAFGEKNCCKFAPDDQPLAIYQARYIPHLTLSDDMEFESFAISLESRYGVDLSSVWRADITLGELFAMTRDRRIT